MIQEQEGLFQEVLSLASNKKIYTSEMGKVVGKHQGLIILLLVNEKDSMWRNKDPLFIIATNVETTIYTGLSSQHPGLFRKYFIEKSEVHWIRNDMTLDNGEQMEDKRIRYRQPLLLCINLKTECMCL
jgi:tRNA-specific 2-thiouridylase